MEKHEEMFIEKAEMGQHVENASLSVDSLELGGEINERALIRKV